MLRLGEVYNYRTYLLHFARCVVYISACWACSGEPWKTNEPLKLPFSGRTSVSPKNLLLDGGSISLKAYQRWVYNYAMTMRPFSRLLSTLVLLGIMARDPVARLTKYLTIYHTINLTLS